MTYPGSWMSTTCGTCCLWKLLRGHTDTRRGCVVALYGWHRRNVPEELAQADIVDVRELVRRGETTRHWIEVALRREADTQACPWWTPRT